MLGLVGDDHREFSTTIGPWKVFEIYEPDAHSKVREGLGSYRVVLEIDVETLEEARSRRQEGTKLCEEFEVAWLYTWASPLHSFGWTRVLQVVRPPEGWATNFRDLELEFSPGRVIMTLEMQHWIYIPFLPLERAMRVRQKIAAADDVLRTLIDTHYAAHTTKGMTGAVFSLCKGLEIVKEILPGRSTRKENSLPTDVREALRQPLHSLFGIANNYLETRHAARAKGDPLTLHPKLGGEGLLAFVQDLDLVIRAVVCTKFGEEPVVPRRGDYKRQPRTDAGLGYS
jgi:hypothetical protein